MLHRLEFRAMGCEMLAAVEREAAPTLLHKVPDWFEEWEQALSRFRYDSELTRLNQIHERPVQVSDILWNVLQTARNAERLTDGLVTPTLLDAILEAGYDRPFDVLPHQTTNSLAPVLTAPQPLTAIAVNNLTRTVTLPSGTSLDFGGSAKGWAAHQAMKRLQAEGPTLVNAGGDIAISGPREDGSPWPIGIADPFQREENIETLFVNACGVATSGKDRRRWTRNGVLQHHIIDPATSQPADTDLLTVTVVAPNVMEAEAAAKAAFILGSRVGLEWIEARDRFAALFILDNGQVLYSQKMEEFL
ncbi:MAG TPA: FAD:protein FMN transferase [Anaerolineales bacterium]|nr:FAD:protein FMN transferase [Anaerolineales bacterium]